LIVAPAYFLFIIKVFAGFCDYKTSAIMKKKTIHKLSLGKETVSNLQATQLNGGISGSVCLTDSNTFPRISCRAACPSYPAACIIAQ
jgi:hypothetical protein